MGRRGRDLAPQPTQNPVSGPAREFSIIQVINFLITLWTIRGLTKSSYWTDGQTKLSVEPLMYLKSLTGCSLNTVLFNDFKINILDQRLRIYLIGDLDSAVVGIYKRKKF